MASIYEMQFEKVMELYVELMEIKERNDIKARTLFREQYPEMFDPVIFKRGKGSSLDKRNDVSTEKRCSSVKI